MLEEGCIELVIPNIEKFDGEIVSAEPVEIAGVKWRLRAFCEIRERSGKERQFGVNLIKRKEENTLNARAAVQFRISGTNNEQFDHKKALRSVWVCGCKTRGFNSFISMEKLQNRVRNFVHEDGSVKIVATVRVESTWLQ